MPSTSSHAAEPTTTSARRDRVARLGRLADKLDTRFRIPGLGLRVGWDSILGLIPGVGDVATAVPGALMIYEAGRMGARRRAMARIGWNTGVDMVIGGIPLFGDVFDAFFKSHRKNFKILQAELDRIEKAEERGAKWPSENDQMTKRRTRNGFSGKEAPPISREGQAAHSSATSPAKTR